MQTEVQSNRPFEKPIGDFFTANSYGLRNSRLLGFSMLLLIPSSIAVAVRPMLIGEAISLIKHEPTNSQWALFLRQLPLHTGINILAGLLLLVLLVRAVLDAWQGYLVQKVGQHITADIRNDLFHHVLSLAMRYFDRTPVGRLITRLTSDVEALGDVFSTGAIGILGICSCCWCWRSRCFCGSGSWP